VLTLALIVFAKVEEEVNEVKQELHQNPEALADELGDLMFAVVNLCRHAKQDPESLLRSANQKFTRRFQAVEHLAASSQRNIKDHNLDELEAYWQQVKQTEK